MMTTYALPVGFRFGHDGALACKHRDVTCCDACAKLHPEIVEVYGVHYWIQDPKERKSLLDEMDESKARHGAWTPWSQVLCVECDYEALQNGPRARYHAKHLTALESMNRTAEVRRPDGQLRAQCMKCQCECWVRADVALLQAVGFVTSDVDWTGPFGWALEQTGGMCAALVFTTDDDREIVVTAMDGDLFIGEYKKLADDDLNDRWIDPIRQWQSATYYRERELLPQGELSELVAQCAHKALEFIKSPLESGEVLS